MLQQQMTFGTCEWRELVRSGGDWDYKSLEGMIFRLANLEGYKPENTMTKFRFGSTLMEPQKYSWEIITMV